MGQVRRHAHHREHSRHIGHRQDQSRASFLEDLGISRKLSLGTRGRRSPVSKTETKAWNKTVRQPAELLK